MKFISIVYDVISSRHKVPLATILPCDLQMLKFIIAFTSSFTMGKARIWIHFGNVGVNLAIALSDALYLAMNKPMKVLKIINLLYS
jgi:hypothetical protein